LTWRGGGRDDSDAKEDVLMAPIVAVVIVVCFVASLSPFLFPGAVIGLLGKLLNDALGDPLWALVPPVRGALVTRGAEGPVLTLTGVLAVYASALLIVLMLRRTR
jgi:hypothetical protein